MFYQKKRKKNDSQNRRKAAAFAKKALPKTAQKIALYFYKEKNTHYICRFTNFRIPLRACCAVLAVSDRTASRTLWRIPRLSRPYMFH
jgi:hypothetical protein